MELIGGLVMGGLSMITSLFGDDGSAAAAAYQNQLSISQTGISNRQKLRARGRAVDMTAEQLLENQDASYRAMSRQQAAFNEQLYGFAMGKQSLIRDRILAQGAANTAERYGRSAERIRNVDILGAYGRQNALFSETVSSAQNQQARNMFDLAKQRFEADRNTISNLEGQMDTLLPTLAPTSYEAPNNMGLKIGNALMGGLSTGLSTAQMIKGFR